MTKGRDNAAESLGDVLDLIRLRRQNGLLSVERMQGGRFEEGEIYFQFGQPTYARTGQMLGQEALIWLLSWHQIYFTFLADEPGPPTNITMPFATGERERVAVVANVSAAPPRVSQVQPDRNVSITPAPSIAAKFPMENANRTLNANNAYDTVYPRGTLATDANTPGLEWLIPRKLGKEQDVLALPLTRPQRCMYLLINGHRTISDLSRCTRKSLQEIERLLSELRERGLISV